MKFTLTTMLLVVALLVAVIGWMIDGNAKRQKIEELQLICDPHLVARPHLEKAELFNELAGQLSQSRSFDSFAQVFEAQLVNEFNLLCQNRQQLESLATRVGNPVENIAGEMLFHLGWNFENPDELIELLDSSHQRLGGTKPCPNEEEFRDFLKRAVLEKNDWNLSGASSTTMGSKNGSHRLQIISNLNLLKANVARSWL